MQPWDHAAGTPFFGAKQKRYQMTCADCHLVQRPDFSFKSPGCEQHTWCCAPQGNEKNHVQQADMPRQVSAFPSETPRPMYGPVARPIEHQYSADSEEHVLAPAISTEVERFLLVCSGFLLHSQRRL